MFGAASRVHNHRAHMYFSVGIKTALGVIRHLRKESIVMNGRSVLSSEKWVLEKGCSGGTLVWLDL